MNTTVTSINLILNLLSVHIYYCFGFFKQAYSELENTLQLCINRHVLRMFVGQFSTTVSSALSVS